jgi:hypothetical protein
MLPLEDIIANKLVMLVEPRQRGMIEFVLDRKPKDLLIFRRTGAPVPQRHQQSIESRLRTLSDIAMTNCQVAILDSLSSRALNSKHFFWKTRIDYFLVPKGASKLLYLAGLTYYQRSRRLVVVDETEIESKAGKRSYLIIKVQRNRGVHNRRLFAPHDWSPIEIFNEMKGLNYVLLRSIEAIETGKDYKDIDVLISDDDLPELSRRFSQSIGLAQFEVYAETGIGGHDFQSVPYFMPSFARKILAGAEVRPSGIRVPSAIDRYLSLAYHLLFHGKSRHLERGAALSEATFSKPRHYQALVKAARNAGLEAPQSFDDIDRHLKEHGSFPSTDILGFYSRRNKFVAARYLHKKAEPPGLVVFFVRDFGQPATFIDEMEKVLKNEYEIVASGAVDQSIGKAVSERVRGGNWRDNADTSLGDPVHWFVCVDPNPIAVDRKLRKKYPLLDNARTANLKLALRQLGGGKRVVHASDNSSEAMEHVSILGLERDARIMRFFSRAP